MKFYIDIPELQFQAGDSAFMAPFGYGFAYRHIGSFETRYYLIPFNYIVRVWYWLQVHYFWRKWAKKRSNDWET